MRFINSEEVWSPKAVVLTITIKDVIKLIISIYLNLAYCKLTHLSLVQSIFTRSHISKLFLP